MANSKQKKHPSTPRRYPPRPESGPPEVVNPIWLFKAVALTIAAALVCAYLTLCLLVYQGQWQFVLHPSAALDPLALPSAQPVHFGAAETGQPSLTGAWIPSSVANSPAPRIILFLPDGSGSLASDGPTLAELHQLPIDIFAFDYRGFGASIRTPHPTEQRMNGDAESALDYLLNTRHLSPRTIIPYGVGLGASLAANLCTHHPELPALIVESAVADVPARARLDARAGLVPLRLFFHERFDLAPTLAALPTPKLLLTSGPSSVETTPDAASKEDLYRHARSPSMTVHLLPSHQDQLYRDSISRFLDEYMR